MLTEDLSVVRFLSERLEKVLTNPGEQKQNVLKKDSSVSKKNFCEFYPILPCTLPHVIYSSCLRCEKAFSKVGYSDYLPVVDSLDIYKKIVSLSFFFSKNSTQSL